MLAYHQGRSANVADGLNITRDPLLAITQLAMGQSLEPPIGFQKPARRSLNVERGRWPLAVDRFNTTGLLVFKSCPGVHLTPNTGVP
jgi:hypothetical protein